MPAAGHSALDKAMRLLAVRAYSTTELTLRLRRAGYLAEESEAAVSECARRHYLDDGLLAEDCVSMWQGRGHGVKSIRCKLRQKGLSTELSGAALEKFADREIETAELAIESKLPSLLREKDVRKRRAKALRFLVSRGFSGDAVRAAMNRFSSAVNSRENAVDDDSEYGVF